MLNLNKKKVLNYELFSLNNFQYFLFIFLPVFLITGPLLTDLAISTLAFIFLFQSLKEKNFWYTKHKIFLILLIFYIYIVLVSLINFNIDSLKISIFYFRFIFFSLAVWILLEKNPKILEYFFYSIFTCFTFLIIDGFYQLFFEENLFGHALSESKRVSSLFGDELILGSYLSRIFPIFFGLGIYFFWNNKKYLYVISILFVLTEVLVFFSGERTAFFYINLSAIFMIVLLRNYKIFRLTIFLFSILIIIFLTFINDHGKKRIIDQTLQEMNVNQSNNSKDSKYINIFSKRHNDIYLSSFKIFKDNFLIGVGVKNYRNVCKIEKYFVENKESCSNHPHNTYIQLLTETGIIGFLLIFGLFIFLLVNLILHIFGLIKGCPVFNDFEICILASIFLNLWPFVPTGNFFNNWISAIYFLPLGIFLWSFNNKNKEDIPKYL